MKVNWKRIGSSALALVLVCCLIFNMMTVPAKATGELLAPIVIGSVSVPGGVVVGAVLIGLGVLVGATCVDWDNVASNCHTALMDAGIVDIYGNVKVFQLSDGRYAVDGGLISSVRGWLSDSDVVAPASGMYPAGSSYTFSNGKTIVSDTSFDVFKYVYKVNSVYQFGEWAIGANSGNLLYYLNGAPDRSQGVAVSGRNGTYRVYKAVDVQSDIAPSGYTYLGVRGQDFALTTSVPYVIIRGYEEKFLGRYSSPYDIVLDSLIDPSVGFATGYADWAAGSIVVPGSVSGADGDSVAYPLPLVNTLDEVHELSQDKVWAGAGSTYVEPGTDVGPGEDVTAPSGTFADTAVGAFILALIEALWTPIRWLGEPTYRLGEYVGQIVRGEITISEAWNQVLANVVSTPIVSAISKIISGEITLPQALSLGLSEIISGISSIAAPLVGVIPQTLADIKSWCISLPETLAGIFTTVIVEPIVAALTYIFVPSADYLSAKVDAIRAEFGFADGIIAGAEMIRDMFSGLDPEPPVIWIDLTATRGSYYIGEKVKFLDMTWYAEYKPTVDKLLSALIWIVFIWQTFKRLPGIISGVPGDFVMDGIHVLGLEDRLPSRNAAYEIQRRDLRDQIRRGK